MISAPAGQTLRPAAGRGGEAMAEGDRTATSLLLVEDNEVEREGLGIILRREGFAVTEAATGGEALAALRAGRPGLILLDMLLPGSRLDGWSLLENVRDVPEWSSIPVLIITGLGIASREWAVSLGARDVVRKPIEADELLQKIRSYVP